MTLLDRWWSIIDFIDFLQQLMNNLSESWFFSNFNHLHVHFHDSSLNFSFPFFIHFPFLVSLSHSINHLFERVYIQKNGKQWINQFGRTRKRLCSNCISSVHYFFSLPVSLFFAFTYQSHDPFLNVLSIGKRCCWKYPQCLQRNEQWRGASWGSLRISTLLNSISANSIGKTIIPLMILVNWVFSPSYPITSIMPTQTSCRVSIHFSHFL